METFVIRVWRPSEPPQGEDPGLRGVAEHVTSGRSLAFQDAEQLVAFLVGAAAENAQAAPRLGVVPR